MTTTDPGSTVLAPVSSYPPVPAPPAWVAQAHWAANIESRLKDFQKYVRHFIMTRPGAAAWLGMASGKTLITLSALSLLREPGHILVIAPRNIAVDTWPQEVFDWGFPLRVASLNITSPGWLDKRGKPLKKQRNLKPREFTDLVDSAAACPASLYTIGSDRFPTMVARLAHSGRLRTRPVGVPHPAGELDLDAVRDLLWQLCDDFTADCRSGDHPHLGSDMPAVLEQCQIIDLKPATASGQPPTAVLAHPEAGKARRLRDEAVRDHLARLLSHSAGQPLRVAVQISKADYTLWPFPTVVLDESQGFKNPRSRRWKALKAVKPAIRRMIQLSGTPAPEGDHEIFPQINLLPGGELLLGDSYTDHLYDYFQPAQRINEQVVKWTINRANQARLHSKLEPVAVSASNTELKLPGFAPVTHHRLPMPAELTDIYAAFKRDSLLAVLLTGLEELRQQVYDQALDDGLTPEQARQLAQGTTLDDAAAHQIEAENAAVLRGKLLQFTAGAVYLEMDKADPDYAKATAHTRRPISRLHEAKLDKLAELVEEHLADPDPDAGSLLVTYRFDFERALILDRLHQMGVTGARAYNGMPDTKQAWNQRLIPVMLIHPASAGHGLNLQKGGHRLIWTSLPDSNEHYQQVPARLNRVGQSRPVRTDVLLMEGTIDEKLIPALQSKQRNQNRLIDATRAETAGARARVLADLDSDQPDQQ